MSTSRAARSHRARPAQSSTPCDGRLLIRASAGSGKTFQLTNQFLRLLHDGAPPEHILATTFTRKAAGEILERVLLRLASAAADDAACARLSSELQREPLTREDCRRCLEQLVRALHRLRICTLDSFFAQLAICFGLELGLPPGWRIAEEATDAELRAQAIQSVLRAGPDDVLRIMRLLSKGEATQSVTAQIHTHVSGLYNLYLETKPDAWKKLSRSKPLPPDVLAATIEELAAAPMPADKRFVKARDVNCEAARRDDWMNFICKGLAAKVAAGEATYYNKPIDPSLAKIYDKLLKHATAVLVGQLADRTEAMYELLDRFHAAYDELKRSRRLMRFEDVTRSLTADALGGRLDDVARRLDSQIEHILLDEFQDTSLHQWDAIHPFGRRVANDSSDGSLFCVGDVKQAIYGWRGGVAEIFDRLTEEFPSLRSSPLNQSYRSSPVVIDTVNRVFDRLADNAALEKCVDGATAWRAGFEIHSTARTNYPGYARLVVAPAADDRTRQAEQTLSFAADEIKRLVAEAPRFTVGVLVRENAAIGRLIFELRQRGVAASEEGGNPLTDSAAVSAVMSALTLADHPADTAARFHVANTPIGRVLDYSNYRSNEATHALSRSIRESLITQGYGRVIDDWTRRMAPECDERDIDRLTQLTRLAYRYDDEATVRPSDFVRFVGQQKVEDPSSAQVRVMTVHQSKGLEFDIVVLPQLDKGIVGQTPPVVVGRERPTAPIDTVCTYANASLRALLPERFQFLHDEQRARAVRESLCVLYVALTRAVHALHMIVAPSTVSEKTMPCTFAGVLRWALYGGGRAEPGKVLYEHGDPQWHAKVKTGSYVLPDSPPPPTRIKLPEVVGRRSRRLKRASPSSLENAGSVQLRQALRLDEGSLAHGSLIHQWASHIEWIDDGPPSLDDFNAMIGAGPAMSETAERELEHFLQLLNRPDVRSALSLATYLYPKPGGRPTAVARPASCKAPTWRVWTERPFVVREDNTIVSGQFDRLVVLRDGETILGAEVIDFKTDAIPPAAGAVAERVAHYRPQLEAYRHAAARMFGLADEKVSAAIIFLSAGVVRSI